MNLPNKLTILRIIMIPIFVVIFFIPQIPYRFIISAVIFALAAFTDFLDGYIARKYNLVTDMGKFLDPIADKVLVSTALIILLTAYTGVYQIIASIMVALILARELIISGFRLVAVGKNMVIAADKLGKIKTFFTDIAILVVLVFFDININDDISFILQIIGIVLLCISAFLTVLSGTECIVKNRKVLVDKKEE